MKLLFLLLIVRISIVFQKSKEIQQENDLSRHVCFVKDVDGKENIVLLVINLFQVMFHSSTITCLILFVFTQLILHYRHV